MNERIKQLAIEAKVEHCISHVRLEEFANLIIKECLSNLHLHGYDDAMNQIKEHFEVGDE